ncbi:MAG TPA: hemerythrin domain-containing protein [Methanotrichaceae archaeon]|nr:hemerythrin domain-containing protein [Methanotrichaceae archaeon]
MKPTEELREEHDSIKGFLTVLEAMVRKIDLGEPVEPDDLQWMFEFSRDFIDRCHLGKEEHVLFPVLEAAGMPYDALYSLMADHEAARDVAKYLRGAAAGYGEGDVHSPQEIAAGSRRYIGLLKDHMATEDELFYPAADLYLTKEIKYKLLEDLQEYELERIGIGRHEDLLELLGYLKGFYST